MKFVFQGLTTENVVKGKSRYTKGVIEYTYNGEPRKQTIMSFSNPTVFKQVQDLQPGQEIEVNVSKNEAGFNEWVSLSTEGFLPGDENKRTPSTAPATKVVGSNYESAVERAARQVLIVKQSSLSAAVASLTPGAKTALDEDEVLDRAQRYADWVFEQAEEDQG